MKMFVDPGVIYLHRDVVDFRKSINGLMVIVEQEMQLSPFAPALFVFCNRNRDRLKVLYWDQTGFCLWYKRLSFRIAMMGNNFVKHYYFFAISRLNATAADFNFVCVG